MSYFRSSLNIWGRQWHSNAAPWMAQSSPIVYAVTGENYKNLITLSGTSLTSWSAEKGGISGGVTAINWENGSYADRNLNCFQFGTVGATGSGFATFDPIGSSISGTAVPWTIWMSFQLRATPIGGGSHYALTAGSSAASNPFLGFSFASGTTGLILQRRNSAGVTVNSPTTVTLGHDPVIVCASYSGSTITWDVNGVAADTAQPFGGGLQSLNRFTIGALRLNGAASGIANITFDRLSVLPGAGIAGTDYYRSVQRYLLRRIGR